MEKDFGFVDIELRPTQISAAKDLLDAADLYGINYNSTPTGGGKTPMTLWLVQQMMRKHGDDVKILIIGPTDLDVVHKSSPWKRESEKYNMDIARYISYEKIRGKTPPTKDKSSPRDIVVSYLGEMPNVPGQKYGVGYDNISSHFTWVDKNERKQYKLQDKNKPEQMHYSSTGIAVVMRKDILNKSGQSYDQEFSPTMDLMQYFIDNNVCLILEEIQSLRNATSTNNGAAAVIRAARRAWSYKGNTGSYIFCLSASPLDSASDALNYFKFMGHSDPVHTGELDDMFVTGNNWNIKEIYIQASKFAPKRAKQIKNTTQSKDKNNPIEINKLAILYLIECVFYRIHAASLNITPKQIWNAFLDTDSQTDGKFLRKAESKLKEAEAYLKKGDKSKIFAVLSEAHGLMEKSIAIPIARDVDTRLKADKNSKCIIAFDRIESVDMCYEYLNSIYGRKVARIAGKSSMLSDDESGKGVTKKEKQAILEKFQQNNNDIRVLVCITSRIATGIDLHDIHGGRQRWTYTPGNYNRIRSEQVIGRTPRIGSKSMPQIMICYPKILGSLVMKLYNSYREKSQVLAKALGSRLSENSTEEEIMIHNALVKTPDQYDVYIQTSCPELSYYQNSPSYDYIKKKVLPKHPDEWFYVETNDEEGRKNFHKIEFMIDYVSKQCKLKEKDRNLDGIIFKSPTPSDVNPSDN